MYSQETLKAEISAKIETAITHDVHQMDPQWITQAIMADHAELSGDDAPFYEFCARRLVRDEVRQAINHCKGLATQLTLPGLQLQYFYLIEREGRQMAVALGDLSDDEIEDKAREYEAMANTCRDHARQLRQYRDQRRQMNRRGRPQAGDGARL